MVNSITQTAQVSQRNRITMPSVFAFLFTPARYKVAYGGRDGAKSWSFANALLLKAAQQPLRILCTREYQSSIAESVYKVLVDQIHRLNLLPYYEVQKSVIRSYCGSEFIFKGLRMNVMEIKSTEGIDICWVEEAQMMTDDSWQVLIPTIRKPNSEIWISFNTGEVDDPTYRRFVANPPPEAIVRKVNYSDNPFHGEVMEKERQYLLRVDPEAHDHVWLGNPLKISDACIFKGKFETDIFEAREGEQLFFGADFGFSNDPSTLVRAFIRDNTLFVEHEAYGLGVELDEMPAFYDSVPGSRDWIIWADNSRPETIAYLKKKVSTFDRLTNGRGVSRTEYPSSGSLSGLSFMNAASTPWRNSSSIPGKRTGLPEMFYPSSLMPITTALMRSDTALPIMSGPAAMPVSRIA
jgi:phage terminase large subunit